MKSSAAAHFVTWINNILQYNKVFNSVKPLTKKAEEAMAKYESLDPKRPRRGRKTVREDLYIQESMQTIKELNQEAEDCSDLEERNRIRN